MESFSIHCVTCKSKLIVSRPDLLGQIFACPKCNSMVQVPSVPPSVESPVSDPNADVDTEQKRSTPVQSSTDDKHGDTVEDFGYTTPEMSQTVSNHDETDDQDSLEAVSQNPATTNEDLADADLTDWSDASTSQNRKKLLVAFSCVSTLIVIGVICLFALSGGTQEESQLATHLPDNPDTIENGSNNTEPDRQEGQAGNQEMPEDMDDPQIDENPEDSDQPMPEDPAPPMDDAVTPDNPLDDPSESPSEDPGEQPREEPLPVAPEGLTPEGNPTDGNDNPEEAENLDSVIDDVAPFLSNSPFTIDNAAPVAKLPKPKGVPREAAAAVNVEAGLKFTVSQIDVANPIPLNQFLEFLGTLGNIPFTFDFESLHLARLNHAAGVKHTSENQTIEQILTTVLSDLGLAYRVEEGHVLVLAESHTDVSQKTIVWKASDDNLSVIPVEELSTMVNQLLAPVEVAITTTEVDPENEQIKHLAVSGSQRTLDRVQNLLSYLRTREDSSESFEFAAWQHYEQEYTLNFAAGAPLLEVLIHLNANSPLQFQANWKNIWQSGWTPKSQVKAATENESLQECLEQILTANGLTYIARANGVLEITTAEHAISENQIGIYDLSKMPVTKRDTLVKTLTQLAADEEDQVDIRLIESLPDKRLALAAPAAIHRLLIDQMK